MRLTPFALILCALLLPEMGRAQEHALTLSPFVSLDRFRNSGFDDGLDYGAAAALHVTDGFSLRAEAAFGSRSVPYDVVGGTGFLSGSISEWSLAAQYRVFGSARGPALTVSLGAGRAGATVAATTVSLGALGTLPIPARSTAHAFLEGGVTAEAGLAGNLGMFIRPALRAAATGSAAPDIAIEGGLRVSLF